MLKGLIVLIVVSVVAIFFQTQLSFVLHYLLKVHDAVADGLAIVFSNAPAGRVMQETIALIIIPIIIGAVAALVWLMVKRNEMPHLVGTVWIIWTILLVAVLLQPSIHNGSSKKAMQTYKKIYY